MLIWDDRHRQAIRPNMLQGSCLRHCCLCTHSPYKEQFRSLAMRNTCRHSRRRLSKRGDAALDSRMR